MQRAKVSCRNSFLLMVHAFTGLALSVSCLPATVYVASFAATTVAIFIHEDKRLINKINKDKGVV
jgi:hypothetical protein